MARSVRLSGVLVRETQNGPDVKVVQVDASTKSGNKTFTSRGADEKDALKLLQEKVQRYEGNGKVLTGYPKTIEVNW